MDTRSLPPLVHLLLLAALAAAAFVVLRPAGGEAPISRWRPSGDGPAPIAGEAAPAPARALTVRVDEGLYAAERGELPAELERTLAYVSARFGAALSGPITATLVADGGCALSGIAYTDVRVVQVHTCQDIARPRAVAILAHEFVHQLQQDRYGARHLSADLILSEGMATWAAGEYWLSGHPDFRSYVRAQRASGTLYPLATHYRGLGIGAMNALYYQWASFVEFLVQTYGREKLDQLYLTGAGDPGSADYAGVYGKGLEELEREWLSWLE
ncbi:MAG TPA: hypothetical protein VNL77_24495 [Roseiflexaceae bacterium]|nr:hypothetical protein [Roseiflexaceae bacterium]